MCLILTTWPNKKISSFYLPIKTQEAHHAVYTLVTMKFPNIEGLSLVKHYPSPFLALKGNPKNEFVLFLFMKIETWQLIEIGTNLMKIETWQLIKIGTNLIPI
ncbi:hypothetical protein Lalb_Chr02g0159431 [Lupinus albus]|uniref:Uncharacterized protein n=1 Tax=Lupinus albus TaxID=3870 RepID=A0A6A4R3Y0_LUPAL|nr:hypothetical protein Lalb_Chr02g0159431 [Lupinus albus]